MLARLRRTFWRGVCWADRTTLAFAGFVARFVLGLLACTDVFLIVGGVAAIGRGCWMLHPAAGWVSVGSLCVGLVLFERLIRRGARKVDA